VSASSRALSGRSTFGSDDVALASQLQRVDVGHHLVSLDAWRRVQSVARRSRHFCNLRRIAVDGPLEDNRVVEHRVAVDPKVFGELQQAIVWEMRSGTSRCLAPPKVTLKACATRSAFTSRGSSG
jgi:hypothetical protein